MKRTILLVITCIATLLFSGCANNSSRYSAQAQKRLEYENWMQHINLDPNLWTKNASPWFFSNQPAAFDQYQSNAPAESAITAMTVRVPDFRRIQVDGPFQIQIVGGQPHNSVNILGPNQLARHAAVDIRGDTLFIHPAMECKDNCGNLGQVIVRIGVHELNGIVDSGSGPFEAKNLDSSCLSVISNGPANILLVGNMTVNQVSQKGTGTISILGANTPSLDIDIFSNGNLNISGRINMHRVNKQGNGTLNIIGASSDGLYLKSTDSGLTTIAGYTDVKKIDVMDNSRVYIYWVNSDGTYITVHDKGRLGLAGAAHNADIELSGSALFEGKYFRANNIYVRTKDFSHANVDPSDKLFANAMDNSSIYFFNTPSSISRYTLGNGIIVPVFNDACPIPAPAPSIYKGMSGVNSPTHVAPAAPAPQAAANTNTSTNKIRASGEPSYLDEKAWDKLLG